MTPYWQPMPLNRWSMFWTRVGTVCGIIGWLCILLSVIGAPLVAAIYHLSN